MKVLFVSSGNSTNADVAPFIKAQGESLQSLGIDIQYFKILGKGISGYLKAVSKLRKYLKKNPTDIIHAHYTLSGWSAVLTFPRQPVVLSLMGDDAYGEYVGVKKINYFSRFLTFSTYLIQPFVKAIICKSKYIESFVYLKNKSYIIPNGINLNKIKNSDHDFKDELSLDPQKKHILFLGNTKSRRKNFMLAKSAVNVINSEEVALLSPYPVSHNQVFKYLNSVDVFVLTSFMEGSPNVIKEAMSCNCPIVSTDVGDVKWILGDTEGCFIAAFDPYDFAKKILLALEFAKNIGRTKGKERILELDLNVENVAKKIMIVYKKVLS